MQKKMSVLKEKEGYIFTHVIRDKFFWLSSLLCVIVLGLTILYRFVAVKGLHIGAESFYNLRIAADPLMSIDSLSFGGRELVGERLFWLILAPSPEIMGWIWPILFGVLTFFVFYLIVARWKKNVRVIAAVLLISSPAFIFLFSTVTKYAPAVFFALLGFYFLLNRRYNWMVVSLIFAALFSSLVGIAMLVVLWVYQRWHDDMDKHVLVYFLLLIVTIFVYWFHAIFGGMTFLSLIPFEFPTIVTHMFTELGSAVGFGFFVFIMAFFGAFYAWDKNYKYFVGMIVILVVAILSVYFNFLMFMLNIAVVTLAAFGLYILSNRKWRLNFTKGLLMLIIICGVIFTFVVYEANFLSSSPTIEEGKAMKVLGYENIYEGGNVTVISSQENGHFITYAGAKNVVDTNTFYAPEVGKRFEKLEEFYYFNDAEDIIYYTNDYNATFIWVDGRMFDKIWESDESGILYFFKYGQRLFFEAFNQKDVSLWQMINKEAVTEELEAETVRLHKVPAELLSKI